MTSIRKGEIDRFLSRPAASLAVALFFGPDQGLVRDRAAALVASVLDDPDDPFALTVFTEEDIPGPGALYDEAMAMSLTGGRRVIRIRGGGDKAGKGIRAIVAALDAGGPPPPAVVIVEAGDLKKTSTLRKLCEASSHAAAIACYAEEGADLMDTIRALLSEEGLSIEEDALLALVTAVGDDRGLVRGETEKLILYKGPGAVRSGAGAPRADTDKGLDTVSLDDVRAVLTGSGDEAPFELLEFALTGNIAALSAGLHRTRMAGGSPLGLMRMLQGRLLRLLTVRTAMDQGQPPAAAMKRARPPVFRNEERAFNDQLQAWPRPLLERAIAETLASETAAKRTGHPQAEIAERHLVRLAVMARRPRVR